MNKYKWICRLIGHKVNHTDYLMAKIKLNSINKPSIKLFCKRCGEQLI